MKDESEKIRRINRAAWVIAIIFVAATAGMLVSWRAPGFDAAARDLLMRARGIMHAPDDIVIVAIDEASMTRFGRFPWSRQLTARALSIIASAQPKVVALNVLYSEPTTSADDQALADAVAQAGNVIVAAQLIEADKGSAHRAEWLRPLPAIESAAAGTGHVNVSTESDAVARELLLREADEEGRALWAMAVETVRVGDREREAEVRASFGVVRIGARTLPVESEAGTVFIAAQDETSHMEILPAQRMQIDYIGPTGSFAHYTHSFADVIDGHVPPDAFRGKYVLIGATAATLGERISSPFLHDESVDGNQHGALMPGVEVLANSINTILRGRFYRETPDWIAALCAALVAAIVVSLLAITQGRYETIKQLCALGGLLATVLFLSYIVFVRWLVVPPVMPALVSFMTALPLALLRRSLATSADLDAQISELARAGAGFSPSASDQAMERALRPGPAALIARLTEAEAVAIFARCAAATPAKFRLVAAHGAQVVPSLTNGNSRAILARIAPHDSIAEALAKEEDATRYFAFGYKAHARQGVRALTLLLGDRSDPLGALIIAYAAPRELSNERIRLGLEIAANYAALIVNDPLERETDQTFSKRPSWWQMPRGVEWKARALGMLSRRMLARSRFVDRALRSIEDGLIVADVDGRIVFANPRAAKIFAVSERALLGSNLFNQISEGERSPTINNDDAKIERATRETLARLIAERAPVEREITIGDAPARHYVLRISSVFAEEDGSGPVLGLVASLSDVTKQRELQQTKSDVMTLVTHELRTPLTAIQGMSEVLAQFDVDRDRRREMHLAINDEAKRLARMIDEYLDITRLESGARPLRLAPVRLAPLIERALMMLDPLAAQHEMRIVRRFAPALPALLADADLIAQAITNLVANAIKYSPPRNEVIVEVRAEGDSLRIEVSDHGYGIPADALPRLFEKFYRVPRIEDADVPGTGLGLTLVREIAELHGGRVTVESELGAGSVFSLRLPLAPGRG